MMLTRHMRRGFSTGARLKQGVVTAPLFYVNSTPHIGHAYSAVLADALARWTNSRLLVGTDENGQKILAAARAKNKEPQVFCDEVSASFRDMFDKLHIQYDSFVRTTSPEHAETVKAFWSRLRSHIKMGQHEGWYCASDEAFVPVTSIDEENRCMKDTRHPVELVAEPNYQFRYEPQVLKKELEGKCEILPGTSRRNEVYAWLDAHGKDEDNKPVEQWISVSRPRSRVPWAIPVPDDPSQSIYVWVDALSGYITASKSVLDPDPSRQAFIEDLYQNVTHIVGKDILKFHCIHWPAFLMAAGIRIPTKVIAHAHWTVNRTKMSKSLGNVVSPMDLLQATCKDQVDALRYFLLRDGRLEDDADFSPQLLIDRCDSDLADNIGNLLNRSCADSMWAALSDDTQVRCDKEHSMKRIMICNEVNRLYREADFGRGLELLIRYMSDANAEFQNAEPWLAAREVKKSGSQEHRKKLMQCLGNSMDACLTAALLLSPVTPSLSTRILERLKVDVPATPLESSMIDVEFRKPQTQGTVLFSKLGQTQQANASKSKKAKSSP